MSGRTSHFLTDPVALITAFKENDHDALRIIFEMYYHSTHLFAKSLLNNLPDADDITAESFIKLWGKREDFENLSAVKMFLYVTTRNACYNFLRNKKRRTAIEQDLFYLIENNDTYKLLEMVDAEVQKEIRDQVDNLPEKPGRVIKEVFYNEKKTSQVAKELKMLERTVISNKSRGIQDLRKFMIKYNILPASCVLALVIWSGYIHRLVFCSFAVS